MNTNRRVEILQRYGSILENCAFSVARARDLPFDKALIRRAIIDELLEDNGAQISDNLRVALISLEMFVPDEEFEVTATCESSLRESTLVMQTEDPVALANRTLTMEWDKYADILSRVQERQKHMIACLDHLLSSE